MYSKYLSVAHCRFYGVHNFKTLWNAPFAVVKKRSNEKVVIKRANKNSLQYQSLVKS